jgi:hypothetical protein
MLLSPDKGDVRLAAEIVGSLDNDEERQKIIKSVISKIIYKNVNCASEVSAVFSSVLNTRPDVYYWTNHYPNQITKWGDFYYYDTEEELIDEWNKQDNT